ncbi:BREX-1 system adenine-specific DNA-methyltransferase PglX [Ectothiorhodospira sp. BSL-9]|uniref:BREX-1 system adenine-specific DNA-methyltransferase PglX n=1 Tax=Ectothiorhodospira sp. BSL-9 TaxID=1442136 RepID=UPI001969F884|nr:BREX-1 system adenine-specific DNA-methyltransferase PglX [Ectothiorhodospira sp. BSL-9]
MSNVQNNRTQPVADKYFFQASAAEFKKIPGCPIAYWASASIYSAFDSAKRISDMTSLHRGISTGNTDLFARLWHEVPIKNLCIGDNGVESARLSVARWFPYNRGGSFRKWYGLGIDILDYENNGRRMIESAEKGESPGFRHDGSSEYFLPTITWTALTAGKPSFRLLEAGYILGHKGSSIKTPDGSRLAFLSLFNSNTFERFLEYTSPTLDINISQLSSLPLPENFDFSQAGNMAIELVNLGKIDWNSYETSWDFTSLPLLSSDRRQPTLKATYQNLRAHWREMTLEMQHLEEENNRIFIDAYGLQGELTPDVPLREITLTCNPHYRYGNDKSEEELEALLLADTMRELISYAVGCMFGRYSLDEPGLILANQGETIEDYLKQIPEPSFMPDAQNVIPMMEGEWFTDNINIRFREFLRTTFGEAHFKENLAFVEQALGKDIRKYFLRDFYSDHVRRYKKRPIYWLFSSPKGSFNALIYMHRYQPHTVGTVLEYLRDFKDEKLQARKNHLEAVSISAGASQGEKTKALKEIEKINKILAELDNYERDVLYPLATEQLEIDLDDGVKANYPNFGPALKHIAGLSG